LSSSLVNQLRSLREGEAGFLKVATPIVDACLARYDEDQQVNFVDMKKFRIDFERVDSPTDWARPEGVIDNLRNAGKGQNGHASSARLTNTYRLIAKVNAKLVLYGGPAPAAAATAHA
jgi:2-oxoglutarate dehydrogenase complex dehydrogenase (E1) component-like enzyme